MTHIQIARRSGPSTSSNRPASPSRNPVSSALAKTLDHGLIRAFLALSVRASLAVCARTCARSREDRISMSFNTFQHDVQRMLRATDTFGVSLFARDGTSALSDQLWLTSKPAFADDMVAVLFVDTDQRHRVGGALGVERVNTECFGKSLARNLPFEPGALAKPGTAGQNRARRLRRICRAGETSWLAARYVSRPSCRIH